MKNELSYFPESVPFLFLPPLFSKRWSIMGLVIVVKQRCSLSLKCPSSHNTFVTDALLLEPLWKA